MARKILAFLLLAMAVGQLANPSGFVDILTTYELGGDLTAWPLAITLIAGEAIGGLGLLSRHRAVGATAGLAVAVAWSILGTQAFARGLSVPNCGCFGVHLGQPLRWWILLEDLEFMFLAWWVRRSIGRDDSLASTTADATRFADDRHSIAR